jgi:arginine deiminase
MLDRMLDHLDTEDTATDEDKLNVYKKLRGNPQALLMYAVQHAPKGSNPIFEARKYEQAMEALYRSHVGG